MHPRFLVVSMRSLKRISFPSSIARPSEYFKKSFRSCTFNYTVIQMASFTWYFFGRVGRIENSMGVSPFVFIGRGKNLEFTRERVFFIFFPPLFLCLLLLRDIIDFFRFFFHFRLRHRSTLLYDIKWNPSWRDKRTDETRYFLIYLWEMDLYNALKLFFKKTFFSFLSIRIYFIIRW